LRIAFAILRLSPAGGLEQHAVRLADILAARGHSVSFLTTRTSAEPAPAGVDVQLLHDRGRTNHGRLVAFAEDARQAAQGFDRSVAFHAIPGFDVVFCADPSRSRPSALKSWLPRYRAYARLERQAFGPDGRSLVLCLSSAQRDDFMRNDRMPPERLVLLPPTVDRWVADPVAATPAARAVARARLGLGEASPVWLWMGLQPKTKGLDRAFAALAVTPAARLVVTGLDASNRTGGAARREAQRLGVEPRITWLGFCTQEQLGDAKAAADLLLHPSRADVTGTVILEAMASGLPVITTAVCGYGEHVVAAEAGVVLPQPFRASDLAAALARATPDRLAAWSANALAYAQRHELYTGLERAADAIESAALARAARSA
jgi:UDP-glucose:(heptosyl)LPS alpha-1,3-glucosyltransferase